MKRILVCCASGSGTSMLMKNMIENVCKSANVDVDVSHAPLSEATSTARMYDLVVTSPVFADTFKDPLIKIGTIKNPLSSEETLQVLKEFKIID